MPAHPLIGIWLPLKAELEGDPAPQLALQSMKVELTADTYCVWFGGEVADRGNYWLEENPPYPSLVLRGTEGPNLGRTISAIYQLVGDRLRICYGLDGVRPEQFDTAGQKRRYVVTYRRQS